MTKPKRLSKRWSYGGGWDCTVCGTGYADDDSPPMTQCNGITQCGGHKVNQPHAPVQAPPRRKYIPKTGPARPLRFMRVMVK